MPRIASVTLQQINTQIDVLDQLKTRLDTVQKQLDNVGHQITLADPTHAPDTSNNVAFTWTGGTGVLNWPKAFIKGKNWAAQTTVPIPAKSSAPGAQHIFPVAAGSLTLTPSTYYWIGWDHVHQIMVANVDASILHANYNVHIICQLYTGTAGQTGAAGGGGSTGGVDLSGGRYKNF